MVVRYVRLSIRDDGILRRALRAISFRGWRIGVTHALEVGDIRSVFTQIIRPNWRLAIAAGNVEHVVRLTQPRIAAMERAQQRLPFIN